MKKRFLGICLLLILLSCGIFAGCEKDRSSSSYTPLYDTSPPAFAINAKTLTDDTSALFTSGEIAILNDLTPTYGEFKDVKMGAQYNSGVGGTAFRFFCPGAARVTLFVYDSPNDDYGDPVGTLVLKKSDSGVWYGGTKEALPAGPNKYYRYKIEDTGGFGLLSYNGSRMSGPQMVVQDPYARSNVQCDGHSIIIDTTRTSLTNSAPWAPFDFTPTAPNAKDLIIYEVHITDFTKKARDPGTGTSKIPGVATFAEADQGKYAGMKAAIPYFKNLGINCIELMPVHEYSNDTVSPHGYSWGYLPVLFFAPESGYSSDHTSGSGYYELREFIDECHKQGIAVILDVVLTHVSNTYNILYWISPEDRYYFHLDGNDWAPLGTGNWIAEGERFGTAPPGPDKPFAKKLVLDNLRYWVEEFKVDGFRFDLIVGTSKSTLETARTELQTLNSKIFLTSENWLGADRHNWLVGQGFSQWNDYFREAGKNKFLGMVNDSDTLNRLKASIYFSKGVNDNIGFVRAYDPIDTTNYLESHDEQTVGSAVAGSWAKAAVGATFLLTSLGIPMVYEGQEFCRDLSKEAQQGQNENTQAIDWDWATSRAAFYNYFKYVVNLRKNNPGFRIATDPVSGYRTNIAPTSGGSNLAMGYVIDENQSLGSAFVILLNMNDTNVNFTLPIISGAGSWDPQCAVVGNGDPYINTQLLYKGDGIIDLWGDGTSNGNWTLNGYSAVVFKRVP